jgi:hypothetical protein
VKSGGRSEREEMETSVMRIRVEGVLKIEDKSIAEGN